MNSDAARAPGRRPRHLAPGLPILGMSGLLDAPNIWRHLKLTTWLAKPFKNDELLHALHAALPTQIMVKLITDH